MLHFGVLLLLSISTLKLSLSSSKVFSSGSLASYLDEKSYPNPKCAELCEKWGVYVRPRIKNKSKDEDTFTWIMPLDVLYKVHPSNLSSFQALLSIFEVGIFQHAIITSLSAKCTDDKAIRINFKIKKMAIDFAIVKLTEMIIAFPNKTNSLYPLGISILEGESASSNFILQLYVMMPPLQFIIDALLAAFNDAASGFIEHEYGNRLQYDHVPILMLKHLISSENINSGDGQIYLYMASARFPENITLLSQIYDSAGLAVILMFYQVLQPVGNQLILRRQSRPEQSTIQIHMNQTKHHHLLDFCAFNLFENFFEATRYGLCISEIRIEQDKELVDLSVTVFLNFSEGAIEKMCNDSEITIDVQSSGMGPYSGLYKWMQNSNFALLEFSNRFLADNLELFLNRKDRASFSNYHRDLQIENVDISLFGKDTDLAKNSTNAPNFFQLVSKWAFNDQAATIFFRRGCRLNAASTPSTQIIDKVGSFLPPSANTLLLSLSLHEGIDLNSKCFESIVFGICRLLGSDEFSKFSLFQYMECIRLRRFLNSDENGKKNYVERAKFHLEWILHLKTTENSNSLNIVYSQLQESADAYILFLCSHGFFHEVKMAFKGRGVKVMRIFPSGPFPPLFESNNHFNIVPSVLPFPKYSIVHMSESLKIKEADRDDNPKQVDEQNFNMASSQAVLQKTPSSSSRFNSKSSISWDCFVRSFSDMNDSHFYITSLLALQRLTTDNIPQSTRPRSLQQISSLGLIKALLAFSDQSIILCDTDRLLAKLEDVQSKLDPVVEVSLSLDSKIQGNPKIISSLVDEMIELEDIKMYALKLCFRDFTLTTFSLLISKSLINDKKFRSKIPSCTKVFTERAYKESRWKLSNSILISDLEPWFQKLLFKGQDEPISAMHSSILLSPKEYEDWIKNSFQNPKLPKISLFEANNQVAQIMWIYEHGFMANRKLTEPAPHIQIQGQSSVLESILHYCLRTLPERNANILGRSLDDTGLMINGIFASFLGAGKLQAIDFTMSEDSDLQSDKMKLCDFLTRAWKNFQFSETWIKEKDTKKKEPVELLLCYGNASNKQFMMMKKPSDTNVERLFDATFNSYFEEVLKADHCFALIMTKSAIEQELKNRLPESHADQCIIWIEWKSVKRILNRFGNAFVEDELFLLRRIFTLSIRRICLESNFLLKKYLRAIRIVTAAPGQYFMKWEINYKLIDGSVKKLKRIKQCLLDFVKMCGASPENEMHPIFFMEHAIFSGISIKLWDFNEDIYNDSLLLQLDNTANVKLEVLQSPIFLKVENNHALASSLYKDVQSFEKSLKEQKRSAENMKLLIIEKLTCNLEVILKEYMYGLDASTHLWTFFIGFSQKNQDLNFHFTKIFHRRQPCLISKAGDLLQWTDILWNLTNDDFFCRANISIVFSRPGKIERRDVSVLEHSATDNGLSSWQRILLLILADGSTIGDHVDRVEMRRDGSRVFLKVFYQSSKKFIGKECLEHLWLNRKS